MTITINGTTGITTPEVTLDNSTADGGQVVLKSSGYSNWNLDNYSGRFRGYYGSTEYFTVDASGNVGIGTSSPSTYANSQAPVLVTGTGNNFATVQGRTDGPSGATNGVSFGGSYSTNPINGSRITFNAQGGAGQQGSISFWTKALDDNTTQPLERARIDTSGNLLVNRTSVLSSGQYCADFDGNSRRGIVLNNSTATTGANLISFASGGSVIASISQPSSSTVNYATSSDYRLKDNVAPMTGALATVAQLNPVTYTWKADGSDGQGFIAHELQAVVPDAVVGEKDAVDADGNPVYQGIDTSFLVATLTAAIKEQQTQITQLQADVAALKGQQA